MVFDARFQNDVQDDFKGKKLVNEVSLFISKSTLSSEANKTGSWRFARPVYMNKTAPCSVECPAGSDIPKIEMLVAQGLIKKAWEAYIVENPFPSVCGRVCFHTCETACNRAGLDTPVAINRMDRFIGDTALADEMVSTFTPVTKNGRKIAIIGAGPSGLACAWFLSRLGFSCEIFEAKNEPGGVLRWGIPDYRLPKDILKKEIDRIEKSGVQIRCNQIVTEEFIEELKKSHDALFIGAGLSEPIKMGISGENLVEDGMEFLSDLQKHDLEQNEKIHGIEKHIGVIGGGNTAIDVARSLVRLGAKPVILYRRRKQDMPAFVHEIKMAEKEGIDIIELVSPVSVKKKNDKFEIVMKTMKTGPVTGDGRTSVLADGERTQTFVFDKIYSGIGQKVQDSWRLSWRRPENTLKFDHCSLVEDKIPLIFGGDIINPVKSVTDAVASGKQAAMAMDIYFKKGISKVKESIDASRVGGNMAEKAGPVSMEIYTGGQRKERAFHIVTKNDINYDYFHIAERPIPGSLPLKESKNNFDEIEKKLTHDQAMREAARCFNCGFCNECDNCRIFCPEVSITCKNNNREINLDYCKGCGVCAVECPRSAMIMEEETI